MQVLHTAAVLSLLLPLAVYAHDRLTKRWFTTRSEVIARNGMELTSQPLATQTVLSQILICRPFGV
jgi:hypothetical protein